MKKIAITSITLLISIILCTFVFSESSTSSISGAWEGEGRVVMMDEEETTELNVVFEDDGTLIIFPEDDEPANGTYTLKDTGELKVVVELPKFYEELTEIVFVGTLNRDNNTIFLQYEYEVTDEDYQEIIKYYEEFVEQYGEELAYELPSKEELTTIIYVDLHKVDK